MEGGISYGDTARTLLFMAKSTLIHPFELTLILVVHFAHDATVKTWIKFAHTGGVGHP
jgi:hypothetical protein